MGLRKLFIKFLFGKTPPTVIEKQTEIHHHHDHYYPQGDKIPDKYDDGSGTARQGGSNLTGAKELENVWMN